MTTKIKYHTQEAAIAAVTKNGRTLSDCSPELQNNEDVVLAALKENSWSFNYASESLKSNKLFIMKALNEGVYPWGLLEYTNMSLKPDLELMALAIEKSNDGWEFQFAKGEAEINKELAAKALVKWGNRNGSENFGLRKYLSPTIKKFFPKKNCYEKAQSYLIQLEQEKQAEMASGGSTEEDAVVW